MQDLITDMKRLLAFGRYDLEDFELRHLHLAGDIHAFGLLPTENQLLRCFGD